MTTARAAWLLVLCAFSPLARAQTDPWVGTWSNEAVRLELRPAASGYEGSLEVSGRAYPVQVARQGTGLTGGFQVDAARFTLSLQREGELLVMRSDGNEHRLRRAAPPAAQGPVAPWRWESVALPGPLAEQSAMAARARPTLRADASALLRATLAQIQLAFGAPARVAGALVDVEGREGQLLFESRYQGVPVRGLVAVRSAGGEGPHEVAVGWARREALAGVWGGLLQALSGGGAAAPQPAQTVEWLPVAQFPDGSGQVRVPRGWTVTFAQKGAVDANGPQGWISLGAARTVTTRASALQQQQQFGMTPPLVADYTDPARVMVDLIPCENAWAERSGSAWRTESCRVIEQAPTEYPQGKAAYVHTEAVSLNAQTNERTPVRALTLVVIAPVSHDSFMYYTSAVGAPADKWSASLPVLLECWRSWQVSQQELQRRLDQAAQTMREINEIMRGTVAERQHSYDNVNKAWNHALRGDWPIEDTQDGRRADVENDHLRPTLDALNREAGYERYREVPIRELVPR